MKQLYTLLLFLGFTVLQSSAQTYSFAFDSKVRSYIVHLPTGYTPGNHLPLVINMHGYLSTNTQQQSLSGMNSVADTANFIVVYPQGISNKWNAYGSPTNTVKDVGFISALIDTMKKNYGIDSTKVYACGLSNGGFMSYRLACELYGKVAAIASVGGLFADSIRVHCQNVCNMPIMHFHGTTDPVVSYNGGASTTGEGTYVGVDSTVKWWVAHNSCPSTPVVTNIPDITTSDNCTVTKYEYSPCQNGSEIIFYKITGGGHTWPGSTVSSFFGNINMDINASAEMWNFFKRYTLNCYQDGIQEDIQENGFMLFPNPVRDVLHLKINLDKEKGISIFDFSGRPAMVQKLSGKEGDLNVSLLSSGLYFLRVDTNGGSSVVKFVKE